MITKFNPFFYPFTQTTCFNSATISTRSDWLRITSSMFLYAPGISSITPVSLRHSTPLVMRSKSSRVKRFFAAVRDILRPAPCEQELYDCGFPKTFDDERFRAHRAGNNSVASFFGIDRAFARDENFFAEMRFFGAT